MSNPLMSSVKTQINRHISYAQCLEVIDSKYYIRFNSKDSILDIDTNLASNSGLKNDLDSVCIIFKASTGETAERYTFIRNQCIVNIG